MGAFSILRYFSMKRQFRNSELRDIPTDDPIRIFNRALFPGVILVTEIYLDVQQLCKLFVSCKEQIVVGRHGFHLGKSLFDTYERLVDIRNRHPQNLFQK